MKLISFFYLFVSLLFLISCSKDNIKKSVIEEKSLELQVSEAYNKGFEALKIGDVIYAAKNFNEAETLFPQSTWAPRSALMAAYSYYMQNYYAEAILNLERYINTYPDDPDVSYAHYLIAMCYYEQIPTIDRDQRFTRTHPSRCD